jgi:hypothetical protein
MCNQPLCRAVAKMDDETFEHFRAAVREAVRAEEREKRKQDRTPAPTRERDGREEGQG